MANVITPRSEDYSRWYTDVVTQAPLADYSPVKATGHENAYFPLFIPESFLMKEKEHVKGFAPECAVVTHGGGKELEEKLYIRPTSETIIHTMYAKWIQSYRDLPILINQWANIVRWEMRTRLFLRTTEFLWQEGHTAHATEQEGIEETMRMLDVYDTFARDWMALPTVKGLKTEAEKFAGAVRTYCIEALMQDNKSLQAGTSHHLGQNFSRAFEVKYQTESGGWEYVWNTSWGVSTRLVGAIVMAHGDDNGLVLPPKLAPVQVVIVPIFKENEKSRVLPAAEEARRALEAGGVRVKTDAREGIRPGWKFNEWELKGVPLRLELGPRDLDAEQATAVRRHNREKTPLPLASLADMVPPLLDRIQRELYDAALARREKATHVVDDYATFKETIESPGGFLRCHWCGSQECEATIKEETKATIRCIPLDAPEEKGRCLVCGKDSSRRVHFARAY